MSRARRDGRTALSRTPETDVLRTDLAPDGSNVRRRSDDAVRYGLDCKPTTYVRTLPPKTNRH